MSESQQLVREWRLLQLLADSRVGYTLRELTAELEVCDRTVRRDLAVLEQAGFRVKEIRGPHGRKRWRVEGFEEHLQFTVTELLSVLLARQFLEPLAGTPFWEGQQKVFSKIRGALGDQAVRFLRKVAGSLYATSVGASDYSQRGQLIDDLMLAIEDRLVTLIVYQSDQSTEPVEQEVYPLGLVHHRGSLYLIAWSSRRGQERTFKVDRIEQVNTTRLKAQVPEDFDLQNYLRHSFGVFHGAASSPEAIRVHFNRSVARYVREGCWHASQQLTEQRDGSVIAEFQLSDTTEIKRWIMSFGPAAKVLQPQELVNEISCDLEAMQSQYVRGDIPDV
jgi:predicted DNA-binding transcriptional regulator YafY